MVWMASAQCFPGMGFSMTTTSGQVSLATWIGRGHKDTQKPRAVADYEETAMVRKVGG